MTAAACPAPVDSARRSPRSSASTSTRLRDALRAVDGPKRARRGDAQGIATALNVDVAQVRAILDAFRAEEAARRAARRDAFAASLAHELGMPAQQVSEALSAMPARRGHHR